MNFHKMIFKMSKNNKPFHCWVKTSKIKVGDFILTHDQDKGSMVIGLVDDNLNIIEKGYKEQMDYINNGYFILKRNNKIEEILKK